MLIHTHSICSPVCVLFNEEKLLFLPINSAPLSTKFESAECDVRSDHHVAQIVKVLPLV